MSSKDPSELIRSIIDDAIENDASDIHFDPTKKSVSLRFRSKGSLKQVAEIDYKLYRKIQFQLKRDAKVNSVQSTAQDGRVIHTKKDGSQTALRFASTYCQMFDADKITLRIAGTDVNLLDLEKLQFRQNDILRLKMSLKKNFGLVLVTGPTGSGKTTTLYSALNYIKNLGTLNILTAEDPVESPVSKTVQFETTPTMSFDDILKSFLRHDPDIIMLGETRNAETASISVRAALTGHLVLTTLHANTALLSITRMLDLGIDPFNLVFTTVCILNQRLLKTLCPHCKMSYSPDQEAEIVFKKLNEKLPETLYRRNRRGCKECSGGIDGRAVVYELITLDSDDQTQMFEMIKDKKSLEVDFIEYYRAKYPEYQTLAEMACEYAKNGQISVDEILAFLS